MSEFERTKQKIGDRTIIMTSWFDESKQTWRASAPAYSHLSSLFDAARVDCSSRHAALECLSGLLAGHFRTLAR